MIESVLIVAVPVRANAHDVRPGPAAFAFALHWIVVGVVRLPSAVPVNFRSPGQLALKDPFAEDAVCSLTFHLKSVQVLGVGMSVDELQLPSSELLLLADGSVSELLCSKLVQPATAVPAASNMVRKAFFISISRRDSLSSAKANGPVTCGYRTDCSPRTGAEERQVYHPIHQRFSRRLRYELDSLISVSIAPREFRNRKW